MPLIGAMFYIFATLTFGYVYQQAALDRASQAGAATQAKVMAQRMIYYIGKLEGVAAASPASINKKIHPNSLNVPGWFKYNDGSETLKLAIDSGVAFVYCDSDCPPRLLDELVAFTHGSPLAGQVVGNKISSPILKTTNRPTPALIPNGAVVYSQ